jgi:TolA-binding protein
MNKTVSVGTILTILLIVLTLGTSALAVNYYLADQREMSRTAKLTDQLTQTTKALDETRHRLADAQAQLTEARQRLGETQNTLNSALQESQRRLGIIFSQQENVRILKSCLGGVASDDLLFRSGTDSFFQWLDGRDDFDLQQAVTDFRQGRRVLDSVQGDCQRASTLFQ